MTKAPGGEHSVISHRGELTHVLHHSYNSVSLPWTLVQLLFGLLTQSTVSSSVQRLHIFHKVRSIGSRRLLPMPMLLYSVVSAINPLRWMVVCYSEHAPV